MPRIGRGLVGALALAAVVALAPNVVDHFGQAPGQATPAASAQEAASVAELLASVTVVPVINEVPGYERGCGIDKKTRLREGCVFGPAWNDPLDRSGCDTRSRLLAASLSNVKFKSGTRKCKPVAGVLSPDPYTGRTVDIADVEADHIVSLHRAWNAGAWQWDSRLRQILANDMDELIAVSRQANREKSDAGLDEWVPSYRPCSYVHRYLRVAIKYQLPISEAEVSAAETACQSA